MWPSMTSSRFCHSLIFALLKKLIVSRAEKDYILISTQVGAGDDYVLTVAGFNAALSTLGDSMWFHNGMKFSTK